MVTAKNEVNEVAAGPEACSRAGKRSPAAEDGESIRPRLLSVDQASVFLGISAHSLRHRIAEGSIPFVRPGGGRRILLDIRDLERLIEEWKVNGR